MRIWLDPGKLETYRLTPDDDHRATRSARKSTGRDPDGSVARPQCQASS